MEPIIGDLVYIPEMEPFSLNFQMAGYDTSLYLVNGAAFIALIVFHFCLIVLFGVLFTCANKCRCAQKLKASLRAYLLWNGLIRLLIETFLELCVLSLLNIDELQWYEGLNFVRFSNYTAIITIVVCVLMPAVIIIIACKHKGSWKEESFSGKYGSFF